MKVGDHHLTYCLNVHAGVTLADVERNIIQHVLPLKERLSPNEPFGVGLRLAGQASTEVLAGDNLSRFKTLLDENGLYVFTMNGFPYGPFHGTAVKASVHTPYWDDPERLGYTKRLIDILAVLLPEGMDGGISTNPFGYRPLIEVTDDTWRMYVERTVDTAEHLIKVRRHTGKHIHVDIEPEPDGLLGNSRELIKFFETWLIPLGTDMLADRLQIAPEDAGAALLDHIQICFDTCHSAVSYEEPTDVLAEFERLGIRVGKIQISSALRFDLAESVDDRTQQAEALRAFDEPVYLHQVIQRNVDGSLTAWLDLPDALPHIADPEAKEWRIHFHVPVFISEFGEFDSTQESIVKTFNVFKQQPFTSHLEVETYTWDVLPDSLKLPIEESIEREYRWVLNAIK